MKKESNSPLRWFGGKGHLVSKLLEMMPKHHVFAEPFGGGASFLFAKKPKGTEVYNDIDHRLIYFFKLMQNEHLFKQLQHRLLYTLYSVEEFEIAVTKIKNDKYDDDIDKAYCWYLMLNQGISGIICESKGQWCRNFDETTPKNILNWTNKLDKLESYHKRLLRVQIDNKDALEFIKYWDTNNTFFYIDPPYVLDTRNDIKKYINEPDNDYHEKLIDLLLTVKGKVMLSGYDHPIYDKLSSWYKVKIETVNNSGCTSRTSGLQGVGNKLEKQPRTEIVWMNYNYNTDKDSSTDLQKFRKET